MTHGFTHENFTEFYMRPKVAKLPQYIMPKADKYHRVASTNDNAQLFVKMGQKYVNKAYGNNITGDGPCGYYDNPFRNVDWMAPFRSKFVSEYKILARNMLLATTRPKSVRFMAMEFIEQELKLNEIYDPMADSSPNYPFAAMHWRYDIGDFGSHCRRDRRPYKSTSRMCQILLYEKGFKGKVVAEGVTVYLKKKMYPQGGTMTVRPGYKTLKGELEENDNKRITFFVAAPPLGELYSL